MSFTYSLSTDTGKIRLWIGDTDSASPVFSDEEIAAMYTQSENDIRQTAANLLYALASSRARLAKMKSAGKYSEDTRSIAKDLREQATAILEGANAPYDAVVEQTFGPLTHPYDGAGEREFIKREDLRNET